MLPFEFVTSSCIIFGNGRLQDGIISASSMGKRPLVVHSAGGVPVDNVLRPLRETGITASIYSVDHEPSVDLIQMMVSFAREKSCDFVIAFGGGSVIDAGKATSAMLTNDGDLLDYLEVVGKNKPILNPAAPCVTIPTTAGTGAEVTRNAVLAVPERKVKVSLRSNYLIPKLAIVDPEQTITLPASITAFTGMDALTQVIEPYVSAKHNPFMDQICLDGMTRSARSLIKAYENGSDLEARYDLGLTSLYGGMALTNAGLGAVHGFAGPIGGMYDIPHGAVCGILLPYVFRANINALKERNPDSEIIQRFSTVVRKITGMENPTMEQGIQWLIELVEKIKIPRLSEYGLSRTDFPTIVEKARVASSMKANPIILTETELLHILEEAY